MASASWRAPSLSGEASCLGMSCMLRWGQLILGRMYHTT